MSKKNTLNFNEFTYKIIDTTLYKFITFPIMLMGVILLLILSGCLYPFYYVGKLTIEEINNE